jgi:Fibronectin type III domain
MHTISEQTAGRAGKVLGVFSRIIRPAIVLGGILLLVLLHNPAQAETGVTLTWTPSPSPNITGYNVYYGLTNGTYSQMVNAGNVTNAVLSGLTGGTTYYFAVTAYNSFGIQSAFSIQASYALPPTLTGLQIRAAPGGAFILTLVAPTSQTNEILATQNFTVWTVIATVTLEAGSTFNFTDTAAANYPMRFYRMQEVP